MNENEPDRFPNRWFHQIEPIFETVPELLRMGTQSLSPEQLINHQLPSDPEEVKAIGLSHSEILDVLLEVAREAYQDATIDCDGIRVGEPRWMSADSEASEDAEAPMYYGRSTFSLTIPAHRLHIRGSDIYLSLGALRAYPEAPGEEFGLLRIFLGYRNQVCLNLSLSTDGVSRRVFAQNADELREAVRALISSYEPEKEAEQIRGWAQQRLNRRSFFSLMEGQGLALANGISHHRMLPFTYAQRQRVIRDYRSDPNFRADRDGSISLFRLLNLFTEALKDAPFERFLQDHAQVWALVKRVGHGLKQEEMEGVEAEGGAGQADVSGPRRFNDFLMRTRPLGMKTRGNGSDSAPHELLKA